MNSPEELKPYDEKLTLSVDVTLPARDERVVTATYRESRPKLIEREGDKCWICQITEAISGKPNQTHHHPIERSFANMVDFDLVQKDCEEGHWGPYAQQFDWATFWEGATAVVVTIKEEQHPGAPELPMTYTYRKPKDPYLFVDDMTVNGKVACENHHVGKDAGFHAIPFPLLMAEKYGIPGYQFSPNQVIEHYTPGQQQQGLASDSSTKE